MRAPGQTIPLSPVEAALAQLAAEVRAAELARVEQAFAQRLQAIRDAHGIPSTAAVHVVPDPRTPGAWLLFLPPSGGSEDTTTPPDVLEALRTLDGAALFEEPAEAPAEPLPPELDPAWAPGQAMPNGQIPSHLRPQPPRLVRRRALAAAEPVDLGS